MKKALILTIFGMLSASLHAEPEFLSGTGFEPLATGAINLVKVGDNGRDSNALWEAGVYNGTVMETNNNVSAFTTIREHSGDGYALPDAYFPEGSADAQAKYYESQSGADEKYLAIDSGATTIARRIKQGWEETASLPVATNDYDGLYLDTMVQFTATDIPPTPNYNDKLLVWLYDDAEAGSTNLMITSGRFADGTYSTAVTSRIPVGCVDITEGKWYRLTITAEMFVYQKGLTEASDRSTIRFKVYIDGRQVEAENGESAFLSMIGYQKSKYYAKIYQVGFSGQGAVDDLIFGTGTPFEITDFTYIIDVHEGIASYRYTIYDGGEVLVSETAYGDVAITDHYKKRVVVSDIDYKPGFLPDDESRLEGQILEGETLQIGAKPLSFTVTIGDANANYSTLSEVTNAISDAVSATITLNAEYSLKEGETLRISNAVVLDLNGYSIESGYAANIIAVQSGGSLVLKDSKNSGSIRFADGVDASGFYLIRRSGGTVTIGENPQDAFKLDNGRVYARLGLTVIGGLFAQLPFDGKVELTDVCPKGYTLAKDEGEDYYSVKATGEPTGEEMDDGSGNTFTVPSNLEPPAGKSLTSDTGKGMNYAQAYALGLWNGTKDGEVDDLPGATISIDTSNGKVTVSYEITTVLQDYTVKTYLQSKETLGEEWPATVKDEGSVEISGTGTDDDGMKDSRFYRVVITISDKL